MYAFSTMDLRPLLATYDAEPPSLEEVDGIARLYRSRTREIDQLAHRACTRELDQQYRLLPKRLSPRTQDEISMLLVDCAGAVNEAAVQVAMSHTKDYPTKLKLADAVGTAVFRLIVGYGRSQINFVRSLRLRGRTPRYLDAAVPVWDRAPADAESREPTRRHSGAAGPGER